MAVMFKKTAPFQLDFDGLVSHMDDKHILFSPLTTANKLQKIDLTNRRICWNVEDGSKHVFDNLIWISNPANSTLRLVSYENGSVLKEIPLDNHQRIVGYHENNPIIRNMQKSEFNYQCVDMLGNLIWEGKSSHDIWEISMGKMLWAPIRHKNRFNVLEFYKIAYGTLIEQWKVNIFATYNKQIDREILKEDAKIPYYHYLNRVFDNHFLLDIGYQGKFDSCTYLSSLDFNTGELQWFSEEEGVENFTVYKNDIILCRKGEIVIIDLHTGITKKKGPIQTNGMQLDTRECNRFTIKDGLMYVCFNNFAGMRSIGVVEMENFNVLWYEDVEGPGAYRRYTLFAPMIVDNDIYVIDSEHNLLSWERTH